MKDNIIERPLVVSLGSVASLLTLPHSDEVSSLYYQHKNLKNVLSFIPRCGYIHTVLHTSPITTSSAKASDIARDRPTFWPCGITESSGLVMD